MRLSYTSDGLYRLLACGGLLDNGRRRVHPSPCLFRREFFNHGGMLYGPVIPACTARVSIEVILELDIPHRVVHEGIIDIMPLVNPKVVFASDSIPVVRI